MGCCAFPCTFIIGLRMSLREIKDIHYTDNLYLTHLLSWRTACTTDFAHACDILNCLKYLITSELSPNFYYIKRMVTFYVKELVI